MSARPNALSAPVAPPTLGAPHPAVDRFLPLGILLASLAIHVPLGLLMNSSRLIATAHAGLTVLITIWVLAAARSPAPLLSAAAYVVGSEVLWRQTQAVAPWMLAVYLLIVIFTVGIIRFAGGSQRVAPIWVFLGALLPACTVPVVNNGLLPALEPVMFNVGCLFALGLGAFFVSQVAGPWWSMRPVLWCLAAPVIATATISTAASRHLTASAFTTESSFLATGGFGPNQVSAILGIAALSLLLLASREKGFLRPFIASGLAVWFLTIGALTFSRGGMINVALALLCSLPFLIRHRDSAARVLALGLVIGVLGVVVIFPRLDQFTGGRLETRYTENHQAEVRAAVARREYQTFREHMVLGVGVGEAAKIKVDGRRVLPHTEYTRLLAEHGLLGALAMVCLMLMVINAYRRQRVPWGRALTVAFAVWTGSEMAHAASRVAATAFALAIAMFTVDADVES